MLLIAGCDDGHIAPRDKQKREYNKGKSSVYAEVGLYSAKGEYSKNAKVDAFIKEGHNEPLAKEGDNKPLAKDGNWAGYNDEPLATRAIGRVHHARQ